MSSRSATALKRRVVAGVLVLLALVMITVYFREPAGGSLHGVQSGGATVLRPFEVGANRVAQPFRDFYGWFAGLIHAKSENEQLRKQIDALVQKRIQYTTAIQENGALRGELHYVGLPRFPQDYNYVATDVISASPSEFQQQIGIAAGSANGVRKDDPVVTPDGLVGKVSAVSGHQSQVMLLTDPTMQVAALDQDHNAVGMVRHGQGEGSLTLDQVKKSQVLKLNDTVVTLGFKAGPLKSIYPAGIPIGYVSGASQSEVDLYWQAQVTPRVHFDSLRSVLVLIPKTRRLP
ncbi:MAG TPA: rod shape-determining protein MreC [Gaiellaceae bacterium]|jgi:rod shape-determining protein MreC